MEWKIDDICVEWMTEHMDWYQSDDEDSRERIEALRKTCRQRMSAYSEYTEALQAFLDRLCNNYIIYKSGLYRASDKSIVITNPDGYLVYQKEKKRWIPIGYLRENRLPYTNKSFVEKMQEELKDFSRSIAYARENWIDYGLGGNLRLLRDAKKAWMRIALWIVLLGCDLAMICYLANISGMLIWLRLFRENYVDTSWFLRFSLLPQAVTGGVLAAAGVGTVLIMLFALLLFRDAVLMGRVGAIRTVIRRYVELQDKTEKLAETIEGYDLRALENELDSFKAGRHLAKPMPSETGFCVRQRRFRHCSGLFIGGQLLLTGMLAAVSIACMYLLR